MGEFGLNLATICLFLTSEGDAEKRKILLEFVLVFKTMIFISTLFREERFG